MAATYLPEEEPLRAFQELLKGFPQATLESSLRGEAGERRGSNVVDHLGFIIHVVFANLKHLEIS